MLDYQSFQEVEAEALAEGVHDALEKLEEQEDNKLKIKK